MKTAIGRAVVPVSAVTVIGPGAPRLKLATENTPDPPTTSTMPLRLIVATIAMMSGTAPTDPDSNNVLIPVATLAGSLLLHLNEKVTSVGWNGAVGVNAMTYVWPPPAGMVAPAFGLPVRALVAGLVVWNEKFAGTALVGVIPQSCPAAPPALRMVANTTPEFPTWIERLVGSRAAASGPADAPPDELTTTFRAPVLLCHSTPSTTPRKKRVAPAGTTNCWTAPVPVPVMPSPMKNGCFRAGLNVGKLVPKPDELKSSRVGAPDDVGMLSSRNSPTSASCGASIPAMLLLDGVPSSPKVPIVLNTP